MEKRVLEEHCVCDHTFKSRVKRQAGHEDEELEEAVETSQVVSNSEELSLTPDFSVVQNINADNTDSELDLPELPLELASTVQIRLEKDNSEVDHALEDSVGSDAELPPDSGETEPRHKCPRHQCPEKDEAENGTTGQPRENTMGLLLEEDVIIFPGQDKVLGKPEDEVEGKEDEGTKPKKTKKKNKKKKKPSKGTLAAAGVIAGLGGAALTNYVLKNHFRPQQSQYHPGYYPPPTQHQRPISAYPTVQPNPYQPTYQQPYTSPYPTSQPFPANPTSGYPSQFQPQQTTAPYSPSYPQQSFGSGYHSTQSTYPSNQGTYQSYQPTNQAFGQSYPSWGKGDLGFHPGFIGRTAMDTDSAFPLARSPLLLISTQTHETPYLASVANSYQSTRFQKYQPQKKVSYFHSNPVGTVVKNAPYKQNLVYFG